jgi:hypothetical protein
MQLLFNDSYLDATRRIEKQPFFQAQRTYIANAKSVLIREITYIC